MRKLDFDTTAASNQNEQKTRRWSRREANPVVQMSVRMNEDVYDRYRQLCTEERRTNGDMLEVMMKEYLKNRK